MAKKTLSQEAQIVMSRLELNVLSELANSSGCRADLKLKCLDVMKKAFKKTEKQLKLTTNEISNNEITSTEV